MTRQHNRTVVSLAALALAATAGVLSAGPINPPAGPVTSTFKTLGEVEPRIAINAANTPGDATALFKIVAPGSYYLTGNLQGVIGKHGIAIVVSGVTLDLNGFDLSGVAGMGAFDGVSATAAGTANIAVANGSVRSWGGEGVDLGTVGTVNCRVEGVQALGNAGTGISVGYGSTVTNCTSSFNLAGGISTVSSCTVADCAGTFNTLSGIRTSSGCTVSECTAYSNGGGGISIGLGCTATHCTTFSNNNVGIGTDSGCTVTDCAAFSNTGNGFGGNAVGANFGCTVSNCSAYQNTASGINVGSGCTVADCTSRLNTLDGVFCTSGCLIRGNSCPFNGNGGDGAGIHAFSNNNRIEGNSCTIADRGIDVDSPGNLIIRNACSGNTTNWDVVGGNVCLVVQGVTGAAILGNTGGVAPGSTDPNANFTY